MSGMKPGEGLIQPTTEQVAAVAEGLDEQQARQLLAGVTVAILDPISVNWQRSGAGIPPSRRLPQYPGKILSSWGLKALDALETYEAGAINRNAPPTEKAARRWEIAGRKWACNYGHISATPDLVIVDAPQGRVSRATAELAVLIARTNPVAAWERIISPDPRKAGALPVLGRNPIGVAAIAKILKIRRQQEERT